MVLLDFGLDNLAIEKTLMIKRRKRPMKEAMRAPLPWSQKVWNLSQILFHLACELPFFPSSAMNSAAPSPAAARTTINCSQNNQ